MELPLIGKVKRPKKWLLGLLATVLVIVPAGIFFRLSQSPKKIDLEKFTVPVQAQVVRVRITANGTVIPFQSVNLSPKNAGRLARLFVEQGDVVQRGQVIAQMENADLQAQVLQAQAGVDEAQARLNDALAGSRPEQIAQAQARLNQAQANLAQAQNGNTSEEIAQAQARLNQAQVSLAQARSSRPSEIAQTEAQVKAANARIDLSQERLNRYRFLRNQGAIAQDRLDEAETEYRTAQANRDEAQRRLEQVNNRTLQEIAQREAALAEAQQGLNQVRRGTRPEIIAQRAAEVEQARSALQEVQSGSRSQEIAQLRAAVDGARAQVLSAQVQLQDTTVRAPFDGIVSQKYSDVGAFVTPTTSASSTASATSTAIVAIAKGLEIRARVPEVDISQIKPGQSVEILADAYPDQTFKGAVRVVAPEAVLEQNVTSFEVRIAIETGANELRSGMNVNVTFLGEEVPNALVVPTVAIVTEKGETGVMVPDRENKPTFRPVTTGSSIQDKTQILEGLKPGERVFIEIPEEERAKER